MKKIYNNVPVQTVLFTVGGFQTIEIVDICRYAGSDHETLIYHGLEKDFGIFAELPKGYSRNMIDYASVWRIESVGDVLRIEINTPSEPYPWNNF